MSVHARHRWLAYSCLVVVLAASWVAALLYAAGLPQTYKHPPPFAQLDPPGLFAAYCMGCHDTGRTRIEFDARPTAASVHQDPALWKRVIRALRAEQMPPADMPPANPMDRERMIAWIEDNLSAMDRMRVAARRLEAVEYRNAVRDLLGIEVRLAGASETDTHPTADAGCVMLPADFPADEPYWTLYPDQPAVPEEMQGPYRAAAAAVLDRLDVRARLARMNHAERNREVERVARLAFRRPLTHEETARWQRLLDDGSNTDDAPFTGVKAALKEVLTSPQFLYKIERRPEAAGPHTTGLEARTQFELASRLAGFLWSSVPDDELLADAERGQLTVRLDHHVARMLADRRAEGLGPRFTNSWLRLEELDANDHVPESLRRAMRAETELLVSFILQENRDVLELLDADYTFVDETLARHYGIEGVEGDYSRMVFHGDNGRRGLLGHASILTVTSRADDTSPMRRGRWILENLLGERVPPPPLGATAIKVPPAQGTAAKPGAPSPIVAALDSIQVGLGRGKDFRCGAYCHAPIAGLGTALENYGSSGEWRTEYAELKDGAALAIIASGAAPTGEPIDGAGGLSSYLLGRKQEFLRSLSGKLLTYGLARKPRASDQTDLDHIVERLGQGDWRFARVVQAVAASRSFQQGFVERWGGRGW